MSWCHWGMALEGGLITLQVKVTVDGERTFYSPERSVFVTDFLRRGVRKPEHSCKAKWSLYSSVQTSLKFIWSWHHGLLQLLGPSVLANCLSPHAKKLGTFISLIFKALNCVYTDVACIHERAQVSLSLPVYQLAQFAGQRKYVWHAPRLPGLFYTELFIWYWWQSGTNIEAGVHYSGFPGKTWDAQVMEKGKDYSQLAGKFV